MTNINVKMVLGLTPPGLLCAGFECDNPSSSHLAAIVTEAVADFRLRVFDLPVVELKCQLMQDSVFWQCVVSVVERDAGGSRGRSHVRIVGMPQHLPAYDALRERGPESYRERVRDIVFCAARNIIVEAMTHEIDESIVVAGEREFDPHDSKKALPGVCLRGSRCP